MSNGKRWTELSPVMRAAIVKLAVLDVALKCWAIADLVNRPQNQVKGSKTSSSRAISPCAKGSKTAWAVALTLSSSAGVLPASYLALARKSD